MNFSNYERKEVIGSATLYQGDCLGILSGFGTKEVDAVVTDPPYGIDYNPKIHKLYSGEENNYSKIDGDVEYCVAINEIFKLDCRKVIWGASNFPSKLPHRGRWLCWHKRSYATKPNSMPGSDFELAWVDKKSGYYKYIQTIHGGVINADSINGNNEKRLHPTQKPIAVMKFSITQCNLKPDSLIIDPFMGSGTTGVAAWNLGHRFIGVEKEPDYFDIACRRIEQAQRQLRLFAKEVL